MIITLDDRYYIERDDLSYTLIDLERSRTRIDKDGKEVIDRYIIGYYGSVGQATERYLRNVTEQTKETMSLKEYIEIHAEHARRISALLGNREE